ncbi:hypothetical protein FOCG_15867 [Fusarium oxysporum f. sp. radicis-lycopersici 26381]|nr:hypothetical protein FOCG_15867 [Fusarium oxysporum f. sp. radicis-lycopersici 26381]
MASDTNRFPRPTTSRKRRHAASNASKAISALIADPSNDEAPDPTPATPPSKRRMAQDESPYTNNSSFAESSADESSPALTESSPTDSESSDEKTAEPFAPRPPPWILRQSAVSRTIYTSPRLAQEHPTFFFTAITIHGSDFFWLRPVIQAGQDALAKTGDQRKMWQARSEPQILPTNRSRLESLQPGYALARWKRKPPSIIPAAFVALKPSVALSTLTIRRASGYATLVVNEGIKSSD